MRPSFTPGSVDDPLYTEGVPCLDDELQTVAFSRAVEWLHVRCAVLSLDLPSGDGLEFRLEGLSGLHPLL